MSCDCRALASIRCCLVVACRGKEAGLLALVCGFGCILTHCFELANHYPVHVNIGIIFTINILKYIDVAVMHYCRGTVCFVSIYLICLDHKFLSIVICYAM